MTRYIGQNPNSSIYDANGVWSLNNVSAATEAKNWPNPKYSGTNTFKDGIFKGEPYITIYNNTNILESVNPIIPYSPIDTNPDPHWNNVSLLIRGTGINGSTTITDSSSFNHNITLPTAGGTNNTVISSGSYIFDNGSVIFDGDYDYLQLPTDSSLDFGSGNFTIEFWMRTNGSQDSFSTIFSRFTSSNDRTDFYINGTETGFSNRSASASSKVTFIGSYVQTLISNNINWYHLAITRSETNGRYISIFVNGILIASSNQYANDNISLSNCRIGRAQSNNLTDNNYNGYLSEMRITKGINRYPIVKDFTIPVSTYPTGVSDPFWNNVSLLLNFDGSNGSTTITDISPRTKIVTAAGTTSINTTESRFGGSSVYTDGTTGNYLSIPQDLDFAFGTGDFTIEAWIYITSYRSSFLYFLTTTNLSTNFNFSLSNTGQFAYWNGSTNAVLTQTNMIPLNTWRHIAFVRRNFVVLLYIDGILVASRSDNTNLVNNQDINILSTLNTTNGTNPNAGYMDDLRVTKGVARYTTGSFTPPRLRFPGA